MQTSKVVSQVYMSVWWPVWGRCPHFRLSTHVVVSTCIFCVLPTVHLIIFLPLSFRYACATANLTKNIKIDMLLEEYQTDRSKPVTTSHFTLFLKRHHLTAMPFLCTHVVMWPLFVWHTPEWVDGDRRLTSQVFYGRWSHTWCSCNHLLELQHIQKRFPSNNLLTRNKLMKAIQLHAYERNRERKQKNTTLSYYSILLTD